MTIKNPSFSNLVVSPASAATTDLKVKVSEMTSRAKNITSYSRRREGSEFSTEQSFLTLSRESLRTSTVLSENTNSVFDYSISDFDSEITGSGITSAYPVILATLPLQNLFSGGTETNFGIIYDLQNQVRDVTVQLANDIVNKFYESSPASSASLEKIRDTNLSKYNTLATSIPKIFRLREEIMNSTEILAGSDTQLLMIKQKSSTTEADSQSTSSRTVAPLGSESSITFTGIGNVALSIASSINVSRIPVQSFSALSGDFGNLSVEYNDGDITKYDSGKNIIDSLTTRLLGENRQEQARTTRQYQLLKAAIAQIQEGRRFNDVDSEGDYTSPYSSLDYRKVSPISQLLSDTISMKPGFLFAKRTISEIATIAENGYLLPSPAGAGSRSGDFSSSGVAALQGLQDSGVFYAGKLKISEGSTQIAYEDDTDNIFIDIHTSLLSPSTGEETRMRVLPVVGLNLELLTQKFVNQIPVFLASNIVNAQTSFPEIPAAINPRESQPISVSDTYLDQLRYINQNSRGENIYMFDDFLQGSIGDPATAISTVITAPVEDLKTLKSNIDGITASIERFATDRRFEISNQCSLTIIKIFYKHFKGFFDQSVLGTETTSTYSAIRAAMFFIASQDSYSAAKLFRLICAGEEELTNMIANSESFNSDESRSSGGGSSGSTGNDVFRVDNTFKGDYGGVSDQYSGFISDYSSGALKTGDPGDKRSGVNIKIRAPTLAVDALATVQAAAVAVGADEDITFNEAAESIEIMEALGEGAAALFPSTLQKTGEEGYEDFLKFLYDKSGSFKTIDNIASELASYYPAISQNKKLENEVKICAYFMFLHILRGINAQISLKLKLVDVGEGDNYQVFLKWFPADIAALSDCLGEALEETTSADMRFERFSKITGITPDPDQISLIDSSFFKKIRSPIKYALQASQDMQSLLAYQNTVLKSQSSLIQSIINLYDQISDVYGGDSSKTARIVSRYSTIDSVVELLYRSKRYQTLIPGTQISAVATRSESYRSLVKAAFKNIIPDKNDLQICIVGVPYGMLERMRFALDDRNEYFGVTAYSGAANTLDPVGKRADYNFSYNTQSTNRRPNLGGPYCSLVPNIDDNFDSSIEFSTAAEDDISILKISNDGSSLESLRRGDSSDNVKAIDIPANVVQAALQAYVEDIYGLYPRYASTKAPMKETYREQTFADKALEEQGYRTFGSSDEILQYYRLRAMIMMHRDFITSRMIDELEASPSFDRLVYLVINGDKFDDIVTEFYSQVEI